MAGLEADTSSYNQPLPVSPLDTAKNIAQTRSAVQGNISNDISIDKQKLDLMNTQFGLMNQELSGMIDDPTITKQQAAQRLNNFAATLKMPKEAVDHMMQELQAAPDVKTFSERALRRGMDTQQRINQQYGAPETQTDAATVYQGVRAPASKGGGFTPSTQMPVQQPPGTPNVDNQPTLPNGSRNPNYLQPGYIGPSGPPGVVPVPQARPLPVARPAAPAVAAPRPAGAFGPTIDRTPTTPTTFDNRFSGAFPNRVATGAAPGVAEAISAVGGQSGKDYAADLSRAKNFKADLYPAQAALEGIKELGPQGVGPGTEPLNNIKSAIITWLPDADKKTVDGVATFEQTRKYLTQIARGSGSTGTNDQLAAAFEANPSIKMSGAATENVLKSVIALRKMQHAQTLLFGKTGLPESEYSKWISENQNVLDPRAFGFDMMDSEAKRKLVTRLGKDPKAYKKFEDTLTFARDADLIEPPVRQ